MFPSNSLEVFRKTCSWHKILWVLLLLSCSCCRVYEKIEPQIYCGVQDRYLKQLPPPFPALSSQEQTEDWGKEYFIAQRFARELDFYRAITDFRRAEFLLPKDHSQRLLELQYQVLLCYYLGRRHEEVDAAFTKSALSQIDATFPAYTDLLVILYETYEQLGYFEKAAHVLQLLGQNNQKIQEGLLLSSLLQKGDLPLLRTWDSPCCLALEVSELLCTFDRCRKSPAVARGLNALLPGSGYLYLGQKQTALTAFLVNSLFIAASIQFFRHGHTAAGIITTSFEAGWYLGGIAGAGLETKLYNECLYEQHATPMMNRNGLFPVFMLQYGF